jgi:hypothetical protein
MANTFNLGNGNWAQKTEKLLAYNAENDNYKPLPFDFDRGSTATRVNKDGLIETVGADEPRIDFLNNTNGHLLLEPSRTNYSIYSENTSTWTYVEFGSGSAGTITTGKTDMFGGTNAVQIDFPANVENVSVRFGHTTSSISSGTAQTSLYIKLVGSTTPDKIIQLRTGSDAENTTISGDTFVRYTKTHTKASNEAFNVKLRPSEGTSSGGFSIIICHPQEEAGSYATSYIPTSGSTATRSADNTKIVNSPILQATNQFTLFFDAKDFINYGTTFANIMFTLGAGESAYDVGTGIHIYNKIWYYFNGSSAVTLGDCYNATTDSKFAISYDGTKYTRYANGVKLGTNTVSASMSNWDTITNGLLSYSDVDRVFDIADLKLYDTALSDSELQALTS